MIQGFPDFLIIGHLKLTADTLQTFLQAGKLSADICQIITDIIQIRIRFLQGSLLGSECRAAIPVGVMTDLNPAKQIPVLQNGLPRFPEQIQSRRKIRLFTDFYNLDFHFI